jgi:hypothetical protein
MTLPVLWDHWRTPGRHTYEAYEEGSSVESAIAQLEMLATAHAADGRPSRIYLVARGRAVPHQDRLWVIDSLQWQDGALMNAQGNRVRQAVDVNLLEWIGDQRVKERSPAKRMQELQKLHKTKPGAPRKRVVAKRAKTTLQKTTFAQAQLPMGSGEDLLTIAARELGDASRWTEIADLNGIRDPRSIVAGQALRMP